MNTIFTQRKLLAKMRACEDITTAEVILEHVIKEAVDAEREACALACEDALSYDEDDPGLSYAEIIRDRND